MLFIVKLIKKDGFWATVGLWSLVAIIIGVMYSVASGDAEKADQLYLESLEK